MIGAELDARVDFARRLAREAGALAKRYFLREIAFDAETKGPQDWVSAADRAVEDADPPAPGGGVSRRHVFGEEGGGELGTHAWLVDPIDGTLNFVHGVRYWCVSIAFVVAGERRIGVDLRSFARRALLGGQRRGRMER